MLIERPGPATAVSFSHDGSLLAVTSPFSASVEIWSMKTFRLVGATPDTRRNVLIEVQAGNVQFAGNEDTLVAGYTDGRVIAWNPVTLKEKWIYTDPEPTGGPVAASRDDRVAIVSAKASCFSSTPAPASFEAGFGRPQRRRWHGRRTRNWWRWRRTRPMRIMLIRTADGVTVRRGRVPNDPIGELSFGALGSVLVAATAGGAIERWDIARTSRFQTVTASKRKMGHDEWFPRQCPKHHDCLRRHARRRHRRTRRRRSRHRPRRFRRPPFGFSSAHCGSAPPRDNAFKTRNHRASSSVPCRMLTVFYESSLLVKWLLPENESVEDQSQTLTNPRHSPIGSRCRPIPDTRLLDHVAAPPGR